MMCSVDIFEAVSHDQANLHYTGNGHRTIQDSKMQARPFEWEAKFELQSPPSDLVRATVRVEGSRDHRALALDWLRNDSGRCLWSRYDARGFVQSHENLL